MSTHFSRHAALAAALCAALALGGCGGDSKTRFSEPPPTGGTPAPPPVASDSFFDYVLARVNALLDDAEPASIDAVTETKPENTEPAPVG
ncbi:hypothetical protein [Massilia sp. Leaf139]|uniref:hypothetical protein n=1 Tax=Massilia sp. Leaf139 TaxID=1736272 RepID=UPI0006FAADAC|nr:hypothetical protein [Massilia sp. Leaf139]KQQ87826.1 hypothetical protein ASF77_13900 [Massilia sp. Leaf139]